MLAVWIGAAAAQQPTPNERPSFEQLDSDGDGYISKQEARARRGLPQLFSYYDSDGDGRLSRKEYEAMLTDATETARHEEILH